MAEVQTCTYVKSQNKEEDVAILRCEDYSADPELAQVSDSGAFRGKTSAVAKDAGPREKLASERKLRA